jgi:hypothetical protein
MSLIAALTGWLIPRAAMGTERVKLAKPWWEKTSVGNLRGDCSYSAQTMALYGDLPGS